MYVLELDSAVVLSVSGYFGMGGCGIMVWYSVGSRVRGRKEFGVLMRHLRRYLWVGMGWW